MKHNFKSKAEFRNSEAGDENEVLGDQQISKAESSEARRSGRREQSSLRAAK